MATRSVPAGVIAYSRLLRNGHVATHTKSKLRDLKPHDLTVQEPLVSQRDGVAEGGAPANPAVARLPLRRKRKSAANHATPDKAPSMNAVPGDAAASEQLASTVHVLPVAKPKNGQLMGGSDAHSMNAVPGEDEAGWRVLSSTANAPLPHLAVLIELNRKRNDFMNAATRLLLQVKGVCRRFCDGDKTEAAKLFEAITGKGDHPKALEAGAWLEAMLQCHATLTAAKKEPERQIVAMAKQLPIAPWVETVRGLGWLSAAQIVAEAGDPGNYSSVAKLWKRFGVALVNGERQRNCLDKDKAIAFGYSARRRAVLSVIGDNLIRAGNAEYRAVYLAKKAEYVARDWKLIHAHKAAKRYMEKRLLKRFWKAWRANIASA